MEFPKLKYINIQWLTLLEHSQIPGKILSTGYSLNSPIVSITLQGRF